MSCWHVIRVHFKDVNPLCCQPLFECLGFPWMEVKLMQVSGPRKCVRMQRLCGRFSETKFCLPWMPGGGGVLPYKRLTGKCRWMVRIFTTAIMDKSIGTLLRFWGIFQWTQSGAHNGLLTQSNPSPYPTNNVGRVYPEFLPSFSFVYGGGRENCGKISKRMHCFKREPRNDWKIWILKYCPKDFCPGL